MAASMVSELRSPFFEEGPLSPNLLGSSLKRKDRYLMQEPLEIGRSDCDNPGLVTFEEHWYGVGSLLSYSSIRSPADTFQPPCTQNVEATV